MKNAFEYEAELAALREEIARLTFESFEELYNDAIDERDAATDMVRYLLPIVDPMAVVAIAKAEAFLNPDPVTDL